MGYCFSLSLLPFLIAGVRFPMGYGSRCPRGFGLRGESDWGNRAGGKENPLSVAYVCLCVSLCVGMWMWMWDVCPEMAEEIPFSLVSPFLSSSAIKGKQETDIGHRHRQLSSDTDVLSPSHRHTHTHAHTCVYIQSSPSLSHLSPLLPFPHFLFSQCALSLFLLSLSVCALSRLSLFSHTFSVRPCPIPLFLSLFPPNPSEQSFPLSPPPSLAQTWNAVFPRSPRPRSLCSLPRVLLNLSISFR